AYVRRKSKLLEDEEVLKEWATKEWSSIIATQYRIFLSNDSFFNKKTIEIPYNHISSLEYGKERPKQRLYSAIIPMVLTLIVLYFRYGFLFFRRTITIDQSLSGTLLPIFALMSIGLFAWFLIGKDAFTIHVTGRAPVYVSKELPELYSIAREAKDIKLPSDTKTHVLT
ncbi:MAG: hypothetical protein NWF07_15350, partial [Candidatus Bathyarchaeota archaeon]|nr:hypothetical protein [Candidatus Bathyarchaeota archaeon]